MPWSQVQITGPQRAGPLQLNAAQRQRIGQIEDVQQSAEYQDVLQQEADLTAGFGILRTDRPHRDQAPDPDELERGGDDEQAEIQASGETRRL